MSGQRRLRRWAAGCARVANAAVVGGATPRALPMIFRVNLHEVIPGRVWRSAQPTPAVLARLTEQLDLRSVLSLRSGGSARARRTDEEQVCAALGIRRESLGMSGSSAPMPEVLMRLVELLRSLPRPLLIHCRKGVERSSLASAIARMLEGTEPAAARSEFSKRHGYYTFWVRVTHRQILDDYAQWLADQHRPHDAEALHHWVANEYPALVRWSNHVAMGGLVARFHDELDTAGRVSEFEQRARRLAATSGQPGESGESSETGESFGRLVADVASWLDAPTPDARLASELDAALPRAVGAETDLQAIESLAPLDIDVATAVLRFLDPERWGSTGWRQRALRPHLDQAGTIAGALTSARREPAGALRGRLARTTPAEAAEMQAWYRAAAEREGLRPADIGMGIVGMSLGAWPIAAG